MDEHLMELAQSRIERTVADRVAAITAKPKRESAEHCVDCGTDIPEARRLMVPGVIRCTSCQTLIETKSKHYR